MIMKSMKNTMKCLVAIFMMAMAFAVTGITAEAVEATYIPATYTDMTKDPGIAIKQYVIPAKGTIVIPIKIPSKGGLDIAYAGVAQTGYSYRSMYIGCYYDDACTSQLPSFYDSIDTAASGNDIAFSQGGTYYLQIKSYGDGPQMLILGAGFASGADRTLKSGQTTAIYHNSYDTWVYSRFKATKTGYIAVTAAEPVAEGQYSSSIYVKLLNNKKKAYSDQTYLDNTTAYYGVQKGKTYYIATKSSGEFYNLKVKFTKISEKSGSSKSKAQTIKKNKTVKGVQIANKKASGNDWYKIYLPSSKKVTFTIKGGTSSPYGRDLKIKIIPASSRIYLTGDTMYVENGTAKYSSQGTLPAGTYYLQVSKYNKMQSGWYSIKWK